MDTQKAAFLDGEGDAYFRRNAESNARKHASTLQNPRYDAVIRALIDLTPRRILEVGASNGWRLDVARRLWNARTSGIDPSAAAVADGTVRYPGVELVAGTADRLPQAEFDCVIFGFCLYLCDRVDLFKIAAEADRVLVDEGCLVIYDFLPATAHRNPYSHRPGVFSYKMDYSLLWRWHPAYTVWRHEVTGEPGEDPNDSDRRLAVTVLRKSLRDATRSGTASRIFTERQH